MTNTTGSYVRFVASKSRVAPAKELSITRLELLAALVLVTLIEHVKEAMQKELANTDITCWNYSKLTLFWITGEEREWKQFVQHRVNEIRSLVTSGSWRHRKGGKDNPADIPSRGLCLVDSGPLVFNLF